MQLPVATSSPNPNASSGFDPSGLISAGFDLTLGIIMAESIKSKQKALENKINQLSQNQLLELETKLRQSKNETDRLSVFYKTLAIFENQKQLDLLKKKRVIGVVVIGLLLGAITTLIIIKKS